jgi:hypothetical protein
MEGNDSPWLKMLVPEVPEVRVTIMEAPQETAAATTCRSFSSFTMREIKRFIFGHPRIAEVRKELTLKIGSERGRPSSLASKVRTVSTMISADHFGS